MRPAHVASECLSPAKCSFANFTLEYLVVGAFVTCFSAAFFSVKFFLVLWIFDLAFLILLFCALVYFKWLLELFRVADVAVLSLFFLFFFNLGLEFRV